MGASHSGERPCRRRQHPQAPAWTKLQCSRGRHFRGSGHPAHVAVVFDRKDSAEPAVRRGVDFAQADPSRTLSAVPAQGGMGSVPGGSVSRMGECLGERRTRPEPALVQLPNWLLNLKIADRLTFWFLAISIMPCALLALVTYRLSESSIEDTIHRTLLVTAEQKAAQIETYATERIRSIAAVSHTTSIVGACEHLTDTLAKYGVSSAEYF